ncbi:MAG: bifunctional alpha,alpha-trehalose-phosphate synthase (UDP-forming)/trehalose-phosphatase [Oscillospiraceae bacterium]
MKKIIIISNRLPVTVKKVNGHFEFIESIGGLSTGLKSYHKQAGSIWIGWPGLSDEEIGPEDKEILKKELVEKYHCFPVFLSNQEIEKYYYGFCNKTIWPLFHYFTSKVEYNVSEWDAYARVNVKFFEAAKAFLSENDRVWVHDYQLMLLPNLIKENYPDTLVGFFLHIPFPSFEIFRLLNWRTEILRGILGADLIGFHTYSYVRHFLSSTRNLLYTEDNLNNIQYEGRQICVDAFPMGIDYKFFASEHVESAGRDDIVIDNFADMQMILSVDRLDYTKGIPERIRAFRLFLTKYPEFRGKVRWYIILAPSRAEIDTYDTLLKTIQEDVSELNGRFGTLNWMPVWFFYRSFSQEQLIYFYRHADVLLVTPLRDGMNLVAKEYIASRTDYEGMVVISETAGAASQLVESVIVNPNDFSAIADGIKTALEMPREEKISRNKIMHQRIARYNAEFWADSFLSALSATTEQTASVPKRLTWKNSDVVEEAYRHAEKRILLLDYDGTLVGFQPIPEKAKPDEALKTLLRRLTSDPKNLVCIVSGRDSRNLEEWLGNIENLYLIASHGLWFRSPERKRWVMTMEQNTDWKKQILPILELYTDHMPGARIEEKAFSLAWHYRQCNPDVIGMKLSELRETLLFTIRSTPLVVQEGNKVLEIKDGRVNKGQTASVLIKNRRHDFVLGAGDDFTDEDLFYVLPQDAFSIKVGSDASCANYRIESYKHMRMLLERLANTETNDQGLSE